MTPKTWRERHGMTQQQAADAVGVSCSLWRAIEAGTREASLTLTLALKGYDAEQGAPTAAADDAPLSATTEARLNALEARLNALEAAAMPRQLRFAPDVQALQDRMDADLEARRLAKLAELKAKADRTLTDDDLAAAKARKLAELEALEADQAAVVPMNPYRPAPLTPAEEAARKARRAAAKAAHISSGEPWDE